MPQIIPEDPSNFTDIEIGSVKIGTAELVLILKKLVKADEKIEIINGNYLFLNMEDIEDNSHMLAGEPTIKFGAIKVSINENKVKITSYLRQVDPREKLFAENIENELRHYTFKFATFVRFAKELLEVLLIIFIFYWLLILGLNIFAHLGYSSKPPIGFGLIFGISVTLIPLCYYVVVRYVKSRKPVHYNPRDTFWQREGDKITAGIIGGTVVLTIGVLVKFSLSVSW